MKTLKITISITATLFMFFLFTSSVFAQLEFVGNYDDDMGGAGWNADGSGPEPYGNGHGDMFYYTASRDYLDGAGYSGAKLTSIMDGFPAFEQSLADNGYSFDQLKISFALSNLGDDIEGIDYFSVGEFHYCNFYPIVVTVKLDGEPLVEAVGNYGIYIRGTNVKELESGFLKIKNISGEMTDEIANALMQDMGSEELQLKMIISPDYPEVLSGNGRSGAYMDVVCIFEKGLPEIPFESQYDNDVHEGFAGWDADGTGPEPIGDGHDTQLYYGASLDYDDLDPDPNACLGHFLDGSIGFMNTLLQLEYRGYEIGDLKCKMGLNSLGPDVEGEDWGNGWSNYYNVSFTIEVDGEPILTFLQDTNKLMSMGSYWMSSATFGKPYDISENASTNAQYVTQSFVKDLGSHILKTNTAEIHYVNGAITGNGRDGAIYKIDEGSIVGIHKEATFIPGGNVSGTWTMEDSPIYIDGHITIENDETLTIEPGVEVAVRGPYHFIVQGCINAEGTAEENIVFTRSNPNIMWDGFDYDGTSSSNPFSIFDHCLFQYGKAQLPFPFNCGGIFAVGNFNKINISNSVFRKNTANEGDAPSGGAISLWGASPIINNCVFYDNNANFGGAVMCYNGSSPEISRSLFYNNNAENDGGAIEIYENCHPTIINNTFSLNTAGNYGGAIDVYLNSDPEFINNIFWGNSAISDGAQISISMSNCDITVKYCDVEGGEAGIGPYGIQSGIYENNMNEDPVFVDLVALDFNLNLDYSPCINAGDPMMPDPDGTAPEMGCYYYPQTGIFDNQVNSLQVYPNPASSKITIIVDSDEKAKATIEVFNFLGQKVNEFNITNQFGNEIMLDISSLRTGTYFCKLNSGSEVYMGKFIKK